MSKRTKVSGGFISGYIHRCNTDWVLLPEPSAASIQLALTEQEAERGTGSGSTAWIASGINLRSIQYVLPISQLVVLL